jgi:hypothetical protein
MKDYLERLREYLIQNGVSPDELDKVTEPEALSDIGNALVVTFQNDNQLGDLVMSLFMQVNDLAMMVMQLQSELEAVKNA